MNERSTTEHVTYERSPNDALRLIAAAVVTLVGLFLAIVVEDSVIGFERDLVQFVSELPNPLTRTLIGVVQIAVIVAPIAGAIVLLLLRRFRALGYAVLAGALAATVDRSVLSIIHDIEPSAFARIAQAKGWIGDAAFPDSPYLCGAVAVLTVLTPWMNRAWKRTAWALLWIGVFVRLLSATELPATLIMTLGLGWLVGSLVLVVLGSPHVPLTAEEISSALARAARPLRSLVPASVDARGSTPYFGETEDGRPLFVKALTDRERSADLLFRLYRWARFRHLGDERPFSSLRRTVEHEAMCALAARDAGVETPHLEAIAAIDQGGHAMVLAYERIDGRSLDRATAEELSDEVLLGIWRQVAELRHRRIAHRDLRLANVFLAADGTPWIIDFGFSELAARDEQLASDVAELLASTASIVGPARAVAPAMATVGAAAVASAIPRLQPNALSGATRAAFKSDKHALDALRTEAQTRSGAPEIQLEQLERVSLKTVLTIVMLVGVFYFLVPQLADLPRSLREVRNAEWGWALAALLLSGFSYVGATISMMGAVPDRLPLGSTFLAQLASTFTNRITPAQAGGYALNIRYLQRAGVETPVAVTGVGINTLGGAVVHIPLIFVFFVWAGTDGFPFALPDTRIFLYVALGFVLLSAVMLAIPAVRRFVRKRLVPPLKQAVAGLGEIVRRPGKVLSLLTGSFIVTMSYTVAMFVSVQAFGGGLSFAQVGFAYLAGSAVAVAAPTPGGLGATEAALLAGLSVLGLPNEVGLPSVFLFRLATFWLPILPGWLALRALQRREAI